MYGTMMSPARGLRDTDDETHDGNSRAQPRAKLRYAGASDSSAESFAI